MSATDNIPTGQNSQWTAFVDQFEVAWEHITQLDELLTEHSAGLKKPLFCVDTFQCCPDVTITAICSNNRLLCNQWISQQGRGSYCHVSTQLLRLWKKRLDPVEQG